MKCPKCEKDIDSLRHEQSGLTTYDCWAEERSDCDNKYTELDYQHDEFIPDGEYNVWKCPECKETLFTNADDALKFLTPCPKILSEVGREWGTLARAVAGRTTTDIGKASPSDIKGDICAECKCDYGRHHGFCSKYDQARQSYKG